MWFPVKFANFFKNTYFDEYLRMRAYLHSLYKYRIYDSVLIWRNGLVKTHIVAYFMLWIVNKYRSMNVDETVLTWQ